MRYLHAPSVALRGAVSMFFLTLALVSCDGGGGSGGGGGGAGGGMSTTTTSPVSLELSLLATYGPGAGPIDMRVQVTISNQSSEAIPLGHLLFQVETDSALLIQAYTGSMTGDDACPDTVELGPGGQKLCGLKFTIPDDTLAVRLKYDSGTGLTASTELPQTELCNSYCERLRSVSCSYVPSLTHCMTECQHFGLCDSEYEKMLTCQTNGDGWECVEGDAFYTGAECDAIREAYWACTP